MLLISQIFTFSLALWFGLYLLARDAAKAGLRYAGLGLVAYALGLGLDVLSGAAPDSLPVLSLLRWPLLFLPALCWLGAVITLLPESIALRQRLLKGMDYALLTVTAALYLLALFTVAPQGDTLWYWLVVALVALDMIAALIIVGYAYRHQRPRSPLRLLLVVSLFFGLGMAMLLLPPLNWLSPEVELLLISLDLVALGLVIVVLDAFDEGEALLPDVLRSLGFSAFAALLFGGQAALIMVISESTSPAMLLLLLALLTTAITTQTFADPIQNALDRLALGPFPQQMRERADLRAVASAVPRAAQSPDLLALDSDEFARHTRNALRHFGDLQRLAASPLTRLPIIDLRLANQEGSTLERAAELKALLTASIAKLKPRDGSEFGTSDEWRYYNALYFPYVVGLKPYSRRADYDDLDPTAREALTWFQTYVPERTLYNWQNAAARLVAQDLRETMHAELEN